MIRKVAFLVLLMIAGVSAAAGAQDRFPLWDVGHRAALSASGGYAAQRPYGGEAAPWRGVDAGLSLSYSLHPLLSAYGVYAHEFPFKSADGHANVVRAGANLKVYPKLEEASKLALFLGAGRIWWGGAIHDQAALETRLVASWSLQPRIAAYAAYSHAFGSSGAQDFDEFVRINCERYGVQGIPRAEFLWVSDDEEVTK